MKKERIRITVIGDDKAGIIAKVTNFLFQNGLNIEDLNQTVMEGKFIMNIESTVHDLREPFPKFRENIKKLGEQINMKIRVIREKVFRKKKVAILVTKERHCLDRLISDFKEKKFDIENPIVISNHEDLRDVAEENNLTYYVFNEKDKLKNEKNILRILDQENIDLVILARYMQILSPEFCFRYEGRIINIHPSLLPAFPGPKPYLQGIEKGVSIFGVTAHFVTTDLDRGPIILQDSFKVDPTKKNKQKGIIEKGRILEADVLSKASQYFIQDRIFIRWGKVCFAD